MGALSFEPSSDDPHTPVDWALQQLAQEVQNVVQGQDGETLQQLITLGGSPQGARPKALVQRVPMHTLAGALHADYRIPSCDYLTLLRMTRLMTRSEHEVLKAFRRCVFNVVFHNRPCNTPSAKIRSSGLHKSFTATSSG